ncbi:hypothetical protein P4T70_26800 [Bacillus mobilis]|uniref:hypothetical protein n=1 Tax=Bacillus cereus group TaxID=86661 RepID=UPI0029C5B860|nr:MULTISPECIES: hypothetical protein [Bacillus cereus group]MDX5808563.1 hypothetical protein [Bacillus cereus group sp. BfR-BA-02730]MED0951674.1 hypothetical protein [Bacillus mobilis]
MVVVTDRWIEKGEKVVLLEPVSVMKDDTFEHAVAFANRKKDVDTFCLRLNEGTLIFKSDVTIETLRELHSDMNPKEALIQQGWELSDVRFNVYLFINQDCTEYPVQSINETTAWLQLYSELKEQISDSCGTDYCIAVA